MRLQKNTLFALCSVLEAASRPGEVLPAGAIARTYGISPHHLAKVLRTLARAGLVESARGVGGGYRFVGNARRVTLMDVIELFERVGAAPGAGGRRGRRAARGAGENSGSVAVERALAAVLAEIDEIAVATFRSISLATMLKLVARARRA
ncbi:MAG: Rrf2 family transcriptional regulator [Pseudomonadota bacterium]